MATKIKCPKCGKEIELNIANAVSEDGEIFECPFCKYEFRYAEK